MDSDPPLTAQLHSVKDIFIQWIEGLGEIFLCHLARRKAAAFPRSQVQPLATEHIWQT